MTQIKRIFSYKCALSLIPACAPEKSPVNVPESVDSQSIYHLDCANWTESQWLIMLELLKTYAETETELQCFCSSEEKMSDTFTWIQSRFTSISAAGGLVENSRGEFLLIYRKGHWDLPKGKSETGESLESCALREVEEETGLKFIRMGKFLCTTWHIYPLKKEWILKDSHWYKMFTSELTPLIPQTEEDILKAEWISPEKIQTLYPEMYPLIRDIFIVNLYGKDPQ